MDISFYRYNKSLFKIEYWKGDDVWKSSLHIHIGKLWILIFFKENWNTKECKE